MLIVDRDLLAHEPHLLRDCGFAAQRLCRGTGEIEEGRLTIAAPDVPLDEAGVGKGHAVLVNGVALEVMAVEGPYSVLVSRVRATGLDASLPPAPVEGAQCAVYTFAPQIALAHAALMRTLGLNPAGSGREPTLERVVNTDALSHAESLLTLALVWRAAGQGAFAAERAGVWEKAYLRAIGELRLELDMDGDGAADTVRRVSGGWMERV